MSNMSEFALSAQRRSGRGLRSYSTTRAVLRDPADSHASTDTIGHENDSWAGVAIGWWGGDP